MTVSATVLTISLHKRQKGAGTKQVNIELTECCHRWALWKVEVVVGSRREEEAA
jgi:hypothetical protein